MLEKWVFHFDCELMLRNFSTNNVRMYFLAILHRFNKDKIDYNALDATKSEENLQKVVDLCKEFGISCNLNPTQFSSAPSSAVVILLLNQYEKEID